MLKYYFFPTFCPHIYSIKSIQIIKIITMSAFVQNLIGSFERKSAASLTVSTTTAGTMSVEAVKAKLFAGAKKLWLYSPHLGEGGRGAALEKMEKIAACLEMTKTLEGFAYSSFYCRGTLEHAIRTKALGSCFIVACPEAPADEFLQALERHGEDLVVFRV